MDKKEQKPATTGLLTGAAGAFGAGLLGAIWYTKRKQQKEKAITAAATPTSTVVTAAPAPKMTPAEYAVAKKEASLFAFKTLGYGTLLAFTGAGLIATAVGYWLDVRNFKEFSDKLQVIIPRQTSKLRRWAGGTKFEMTTEEQKELDQIDMET